MTLIDDWKKAHKMLTVQLGLLLTALAGAYEYFPAMQEHIPAGWQKYAFAAIVIARLVKQASLHKEPQ